MGRYQGVSPAAAWVSRSLKIIREETGSGCLPSPCYCLSSGSKQRYVLLGISKFALTILQTCVSRESWWYHSTGVPVGNREARHVSVLPEPGFLAAQPAWRRAENQKASLLNPEAAQRSAPKSYYLAVCIDPKVPSSLLREHYVLFLPTPF